MPYRQPRAPLLDQILIWYGVLLALTSPAYGEFTYTEYGGEITISGYLGTDSDIVIPASINQKPVTGVQSRARFGKAVKTVSVPASVLYLGSGDPAFELAINLTNITVASQNPRYMSSDGVVFTKNQTVLKEFPPGRSGSYTVPSTVTSIDVDAFEGCARLESIELASVQRIEARAFLNCSSLAQVIFHDGLTLIGDSAFAGCVSLTRISLPKTYSYWFSPFSGCTNLRDIEVDAANPYFITSGGILYNKTKTVLLMVAPKAVIGAFSPPATVTTIESEAFKGCNDLTSVDLPEVFSIRRSAFSNCSNLVNVAVSSKLSTLEGAVFMNCSKLEKFTIPGSITAIQYGTFFNCHALTNVIMHTNVQSIGLQAFYQCRTLRDITSPVNLRSIDSSAFEGCEQLTSFTLSKNVQSVGPSAFAGCIALNAFYMDAGNTNFVVNDGVIFDKTRRTLLHYPAGRLGGYSIPDGTTAVDPVAFVRVPGLTSVTVPKTVTRLGGFGGCSSLTAIGVDSSNTNYLSIEGVLFDKTGRTLLQFPPGRSGDYEIPQGTADTSYSCFANCRLLTSIRIPESLSLFRSTFDFCGDLTEIYVDSLNRYYTNIDGLLFDQSYGPDSLTLLRYPPGKTDTYRIPAGTKQIANSAFFNDVWLRYLSVPKSVRNIGDFAFTGCVNLSTAVFDGDEPTDFTANIFSSDHPVTIYYADGAKGWDFTYGSAYAVLWNPVVAVTDQGFGFRANEFGFTLRGIDNALVVVEATDSLSNPVWSAVSTNEVTAGTRIADPDAPHAARYYRFRSP